MSELSFAQAERRNFAGPVLLALAVLAIAAAGIYLYLPHRLADVSVVKTAVVPTHTVIQTGSKVVGHTVEAQDIVYVMPTLRIEDKLHVPIFISDITASLTTADGSVVTTSAIAKNDLENVYSAFPAVKQLASDPLVRESSVQPGSSAQGMVMLNFPITEDDWKNRKSATITVEFYHQGSLTVDIPKP